MLQITYANALRHLHRVLDYQLGLFAIHQVMVAMAFANVHPLSMHVVYQEKLVFQVLVNVVLIHLVKT